MSMGYEYEFRFVHNRHAYQYFNVIFYKLFVQKKTTEAAQNTKMNCNIPYYVFNKDGFSFILNLFYMLITMGLYSWF